MMRMLNRGTRNVVLLLFICFFNKCNFDTQKERPNSYVIEIKQMQFQPALLKVHAGDTIVWVNHDFVTHNVTEEKNKEWSSSPLPADASWSMIVKKSADYYCSIHQVMKGKLVIDNE
jgi:plastocyanin